MGERREAENGRQKGWYTAVRLLRLLAAGVPPAGIITTRLGAVQLRLTPTRAKEPFHVLCPCCALLIQRAGGPWANYDR